MDGRDVLTVLCERFEELTGKHHAVHNGVAVGKLDYLGQVSLVSAA